MFLIPFQIDSYFPNFFIFLITKDIFWLFPVLTKDPVIHGSLMHNGLIFVLPVLYPMKYLAFAFSVFAIGKLIGCQYFFYVYILYIEGFLWLMKLHFFILSVTNLDEFSSRLFHVTLKHRSCFIPKKRVCFNRIEK